jgi:hypothetical protein
MNEDNSQEQDSLKVKMGSNLDDIEVDLLCEGVSDATNLTSASKGT